MLSSQQHSLANPIHGSAAFDYGTKTSPSFVTVSVGTQITNDDDYIKKPSDGSDVKINIKNSILEFSYPQEHSYIGVGDSVYFQESIEPSVFRTVYLNKKLSVSKWEVLEYIDTTLKFAADAINKTLVRIDKTYPSLSDALDSLAGPSTLVDNDLYINRNILRIACYKMDDSTSGVTVEGWNTDINCYVKIFVPSDIKTECNSNQKHKGIAGNCYKLSVSGKTVGLTISANYTEIDGLHIDGGSHIDNDLILFDDTSSDGIKILNNILSNADNAIVNSDGESQTTDIIKGNIIYGMNTAGVSIGGPRAWIYNNTIIGNGTTAYGIQCGASEGNSILVNNLVQNCVTADISLTYADMSYCVTSDHSSFGYENCYPDTTIIFKNNVANDYRLDPRADDTVVRNGCNLSTDLGYPFITDIVGNIIDDTWPIGAYHYVRELRVAIGNPNTTDLKTGTPSATIVDGIITFDTAQTNINLCSGCFVKFSDNDKYILYEKISNTQWMVTKNVPTTANQGKAHYSKESTSISTITVFFSTLSVAVCPNTSGLSQLINNSVDFVTYDIRPIIYCSYGSDASGVSFDPNFVFDKIRTITIMTPYQVGIDCNSRRRHSGIIDRTLWDLHDDYGIIISINHIVLDGLQINSMGNGIFFGGDMPTYNDLDIIIKNNIIHDTGDCGILFNYFEGGAEKVVIVNNLIYNCFNIGISILDSNCFTANANYFIYNNTVTRCDKGIYIESKPYNRYTNIISLKNNLEQKSYISSYSSTTYDPRFVSINNCWCEDLMLSKFNGAYNKIQQSIIFRDGIPDNYHITFATSRTMRDATILSADGGYSFNDDYEGDDRSLLKWDIGCDNFSISTAHCANFSIGGNTADLNTIAELQASITNGVLTFSEPTGDLNIGVGDRVTLISAGSVYLSEKGDLSTWVVRNNVGAVATDVPLSYVSNIKRVSDSFHSAFNGGNISAELGFTDLYDNNTNLIVWCYADEEDVGTLSTAISGWTCSADYKMIILTPWNIYTQSNIKQRHSGLDTTGFKIISSSTDCVTIDNAFIDFEGFILRSINIMPDNGIVFGSNTNQNVVKNNIIINVNYGIIQASDAGVLIPINNIIYNVTTGIKIYNGSVCNNTIVDSTVIGIDAPAGCALVDNIVNAFVIKNVISGVCYNLGDKCGCIANDNTGDITEITINFADRTNHDYHLSRYDFAALNNGIGKYWGGWWPNTYSFNYDIDMQYMYPYGLNNWSIGASSIIDAPLIVLNFSSSKNPAELKKGINPTITITNGIAEFSDDQNDDRLGIGDKVIYDSINKVCYLSKKHSYKIWEVRTSTGAVPANVSSVVLKSIKHAYMELNEALVEIYALFNNGSFMLYSLINARCQINIPMYKSSAAHIVPVIFELYGGDVNEDYYLKIYTPIDTMNECNSNQRHIGWYDPASMLDEVIIKPNISPCAAITISIPETIIEGLILNPASILNDGVDILAFGEGPLLQNVKIIGCIIFDCLNGICNIDTYLPWVAANNIIYNCDDSGIITGSGDNSIVYNNTIINCQGYGIYNLPDDIVINNIVQGSGVSDYNDNTNIQYCISQDSSAGYVNNCIADYSILFKNIGSYDYHLSVDEIVVRAYGKQLTADFYYAFTDDATGLPRDARWDCGALEYKPFKVFYAIGSTDDIKTGNPLLFSIQNSIITFSVDQTNVDMGVGNEIKSTNYMFPNGCLIQKKISFKQWVVTDYIGQPIFFNINEKNVASINKPFNTLSDILSNIWGTYLNTVLFSQEVQLNIACYNDNVDNATGAYIEAISTDPDCTIRIYAPYDTINEVNIRQRHSGEFEEGYTLKAHDAFALKASYVDNLIIEGLGISNDGFLGDGIYFAHCSNCSIVGNIIKDCSGNAIRGYSYNSYSQNFIINNLIYNCNGDGILIGHSSVGREHAIYNIFNNTIYHCRRGIYLIKSVQATPDICNIINNIIQKCTYKDLVADYLLATDLALSNNIVDDDSYVLSAYSEFVANYKNTLINFVSIIHENFNLNSSHDFAAIDTAIDLSNNPYYAFNNDITLNEREFELWERGAFELSDVTGTGSLYINAITTAVNSFISDQPLTLSIHLRENFILNLPAFQFHTIEGTHGINEFLAANIYYDFYNLEINVEANKQFTGMFALRNRGTRSVVIKTYPKELHKGPAYLLYADALVDDVSAQSLLTFEDIKIFYQLNTNFLYTYGYEPDTWIHSGDIYDPNDSGETFTQASDYNVHCHDTSIGTSSWAWELWVGPGSGGDVKVDESTAQHPVLELGYYPPPLTLYFYIKVKFNGTISMQSQPVNIIAPTSTADFLYTFPSDPGTWAHEGDIHAPGDGGVVFYI